MRITEPMGPEGGPLKGVAFDYGGVLTEPIEVCLRQLAVNAGADLDELAKVLLGTYGDGTSSPLHALERGEITLEQLAEWGENAGRQRGWQLDLRQMVELVADLAVRPAITEYVRQLRDRGYRTALITNTAREFFDRWQNAISFEELFDVVVISCDVGLRKPDRRVYELAARLLGMAPEEILFVDDMEDNVAGARDAAMSALLADGDSSVTIARLEAELAKRQP